MKKIISIALIAAVMLCAAACGKEDGETTTAALPVGATTAVTQIMTQAESLTADIPTETHSEAQTTAEITTTTQTTTAVVTTTAAPTTAKPVTTTKKAVTTTKAPATTAAKTPATTDEILTVFNKAVSGAVSSKAGYTKKRTTTISSFSPENIFKLPLVGDTVKEVVYDFLGCGTVSSTAVKGKTSKPAQLKASALKASDITSATCELKKGSYDITLKLKNGSSTASASGSSALDRSPICTGTGDNKDFDHKTAENIYTGITGADASVKAVSESYSNAVVKATVDAASGRLTRLTVSFKFDVNLTQVKYVVKIGDCNGKASTTVDYSAFKY